MKIYKDIQQGTTKWLEIKHGKVGGSMLAKIMTNLDKSVRTCAEYLSILAENMEDFDPFQINFQSAEMARGNEFEPLARKEYERINGVIVEQVGWVENEEIKISGISPDGWMPESKKSIEIKCPSDNTHVGYMLNPNAFLEKYCWQIVCNFLVLEVESVDCISYRPENKIRPMIIETVTPDTEIQISKKEKYSVMDLVGMAEERLMELERCIAEDIDGLKRANDNF